jgi:hypothetical protein
MVGRGGEEDHREGAVVAAEGVETHVPEVATRVQDRRVEVLDTVDELEIAAVVDGSRVGRLADCPRPAGWAAVTTERIDHDIAANGVASLHRDAHGARCSVVARDQPRHLDAGSELDRRLARRRAPECPFDDRSPDPEVDQVLVAGLMRSLELERQVLRISPGVQEHFEDIRCPIRQQAPTARQKRVRLEVVRYSPAFDVEGTVGRPARRDKVAFEDHGLVTRSREGERSRQSRDASAGDDELHATTL